MATELTTSIPRANITHQGITRFQVDVPHKRDGTGTKAIIDKNSVQVRYEVTTWNESGDVISRDARTIPFASWPAGFKTDAQAVYAKLEADAKNNNLIGAGVDEDISA